MIKTTINQRIEQIISHLGISQTVFAKKLGTTPSRISNIVNGRNKPDSQLLFQIAVEFPQVETHWLVTGEPKSNRNVNFSGLRFSGESTNQQDENPDYTPDENPDYAPAPPQSSTIKPGKNTKRPVLNDGNRQNNLLKADGIRNTVEAAIVGGEVGRRWADRRVLELRLQKQHPDIESDALLSCFVSSSLGHYSDQLLKHLYETTRQQIDQVLDQVIDKQLKTTDAIAKIKVITAPIDALKARFDGLETFLWDMATDIMTQFPNIRNEVDLGPLNHLGLEWLAEDQEGPETAE